MSRCFQNGNTCFLIEHLSEGIQIFLIVSYKRYTEYCYYDHLSEGILIFRIVSDKCSLSFFVTNSFKVQFLHFRLHFRGSYSKLRRRFLTIPVQQHQAFYRQQIALPRMMGIGRVLQTHKSFSYCWCERIIHKVRTVLQPHSFHHTLHTHFFFTDCQYQTRNILRRWLYVG